jgi:pimeloyl-ACP methyl ester carboxylesterase
MPPKTSVIVLRDGRRLGYSERGAPSGAPIMHQHGMPGSHLEHAAVPEFYAALGVRVITPDRPGYGLSDPLPHRRLLDWPSDVVELADALGIRRFGMTALSGGGIYALACAAAIPHRLNEVVLAGCPGPMDRPGAYVGMRLASRAGIGLAATAPWLFEAGAAVIGRLARRYPEFFVAQSTRDKPPSDRRLLSSPSISRGAVDTLREALRPGGWGYVQDIQVLARPWGFALDQVAPWIQLWHGADDTVIPSHHGLYLASVIPRATLRIYPGEGHMLLWNHLAEILTAAAGLESRETQPAPSSAEAWLQEAG